MWKQPKCPVISEWIKKAYFMYVKPLNNAGIKGTDLPAQLEICV